MSSGERRAPGRLARWLIGLGLAASSGLAGALLGGLWVKLFLPRREMGWDGIADALGGLMIGALAGLLAGALMAALLSRRAQLVALAAALLIAALVVLALALTAPARVESPPPSSGQELQPSLRRPARLAHSHLPRLSLT